MVLQRLKTAATYWVEDSASQMGAALAYYTLFSLAPLLMIAIAVTGYVIGGSDARQQVLQRVGEFIGEDSARTADSLIDHIQQPRARFWPALVGLISLLYGALSMFTQLRASLNRIWRVKPSPTQGIVWSFVKDYLLAFLMVTLVCIFVLALLLASVVLAAMQLPLDGTLAGPGLAGARGRFSAINAAFDVTFCLHLSLPI